MYSGASQTAASKTEPEVLVDRQRIVIEAGEELELRCGEAAIILTADGRILQRGTYISSDASATQRIRGGSVQIN
jgi:ketosteroid isomerase-like protein